MLSVVRLLFGALELLLALPLRIARALLFGLTSRPNLGPLRHVVSAVVGYTAFSLALVYAVAPLRGIAGQYFLADKLRYDAERWLATAVYDNGGRFVGTFDPRLDSQRDVNYTDAAIQLGDYVANPDHKSIPVREVPEHYWQCLVYHEDRHLGGYLNPYGIDLLGVLKIPYTTLQRSIALRRPSLGIGGSTLPMQLVRVIYNTPPSASEGGFSKLRRKLKEWWLAPVLYRELTLGGDVTPLKQWTANHIWLAQRTGGAPLHGVEITSRVVFGKEAKDLSIAEQFVLASAVNKPIILMPGSAKLNEVRLDRWRYIAEVRARICAERLIKDEAEQRKVVFELVNLAAGPPDPRVKPKLQEALEAHAPTLAKRALANPIIRANALMPAARFGIREEMKQAYGFGWREHVRGVTTTIDVVENLTFHERIKAQLARLDTQQQGKIAAGYTLDPAKVLVEGTDRRMPDIIIVAANAKGEIVRYFEAGETASYFGSPFARNAVSGYYDTGREGRMIASTGKILAAIAIANTQKDRTDTLYLDRAAPARGLEGCGKGSGGTARGRQAIVAFACSLNAPIEWRAAQLGQARMRRLIDRFGFTLPPAAASGEGTPASTAAVRGLIGGSPRRVHQMAGVVLASLTEQGHKPVRPPTLVKTFDFTSRQSAGAAATVPGSEIVPNRVIRSDARPLLKTLLQAPLCYSHAGVQHGTLKSLGAWCADKRADLRLHFAKTGTSVTLDPDATVDTWIAGGLQFANGAAYSYVVVTGTGSASHPWARNLHAAQVGVPLLETLLADLKEHARKHPVPVAGPAKSGTAAAERNASARPSPGWRERAFQAN
ncbi:MAG: glycosyl transferase family 51 [Hyphomicrobiaceae bacterium]|nr:MAG: glycosyl transferase family 51 [Hyphomicrobiaceae bacterium]